jgi:NADH-quinone oxidoreductase subunit J
MIDDLPMAFFAAMALAGAGGMLLARHPMRVAVALVLTMLSLAGVYALLGLHAVAAFQVLIYVGAVMVFMVYVIMLLDERDRVFAGRFSALLWPGVAAALLVVAALAAGVTRQDVGVAANATAGTFGMQPFSAAFLNDFWLHFELVSLLLVAAAVAAIAVIAVVRRTRG